MKILNILCNVILVTCVVPFFIAYQCLKDKIK